MPHFHQKITKLIRCHALLVVTGAAASCTTWVTPPRVVATDGTVSSSYVDAVLDSAAHDIPCPVGLAKVVNVTGDGDNTRTWVTEGCGARLTYQTPCIARQTPSGDAMLDCSAMLVGRVDLTSAHPGVRAVTSSASGAPPQ